MRKNPYTEYFEPGNEGRGMQENMSTGKRRQLVCGIKNMRDVLPRMPICYFGVTQVLLLAKMYLFNDVQYMSRPFSNVLCCRSTRSCTKKMSSSLKCPALKRQLDDRVTGTCPALSSWRLSAGHSKLLDILLVQERVLLHNKK